MNHLATFAIALKALRVNKMRSALTMLGIVIGVAAVIVMIAVGSGAQAKVEAQIRGLGSNLIIIFSASTSQGGARSAAGAAFSISEEDAYAIARELPEEVFAAAPALRGNGQVVAGNSNWASVFFGVTPEYFDVREWTVAEGRGFEQAEINGAAKVAVIGKTVADNLFGEESALDQVIRIRSVPLTVVGVLARDRKSVV